MRSATGIFSKMETKSEMYLTEIWELLSETASSYQAIDRGISVKLQVKALSNNYNF